MENSSLRFAAAARVLADEARRAGCVPPAFRSPPRVTGDRSIRRRSDGGATVAVRYRDRPWAAVLADMVEGVVVANGLDAARAAEVRCQAWHALEAGGALGDPEVQEAGSTPGSEERRADTVDGLARVA